MQQTGVRHTESPTGRPTEIIVALVRRTEDGDVEQNVRRERERARWNMEVEGRLRRVVVSGSVFVILFVVVGCFLRFRLGSMLFERTRRGHNHTTLLQQRY